jgi:hypothetical protein
MMPAHWQWPQYFMIAFATVMFLIAFTQHNKPRAGNYSAGETFIMWSFIMMVLIAGNFFR